MAKKRTDKNLKWEADYVKKIDFLRELSAYRAEFLKTLRPDKAGSDDDTASSGGGYAGGMPTADNYKGPEDGAHGQRGLKNRIAGTDKWNEQLYKVSVEEGVNPVFMKVIMAIESGGNAGVGTSSANAKGIMQIVPKYHPGFDYDKMVKDPEYAIRCSCQVVKGKMAAAKGVKTVHEIAWRYYGRTSAGVTYGDQAQEMYVGLGFSKSDAVDINPISEGGESSGGPVIVKGKIKIPTGSRGDYHAKVRKKGESTNWAGWVKLDEKKFNHNGPMKSINRYTPEAAEAFNLLYTNLNRSTLTINSGWRAEDAESPNSAHRAGMAIDIATKGVKDALYVADVAWALGFRGVGVGGSLNNGAGFVHVDCGPSGGGWAYSPWPKYSGPNSWSSYR